MYESSTWEVVSDMASCTMFQEVVRPNIIIDDLNMCLFTPFILPFQASQIYTGGISHGPKAHMREF